VVVDGSAGADASAGFDRIRDQADDAVAFSGGRQA